MSAAGSPAGHRAVLIYNPRAGGWGARRAVPRVLEVLRGGGWTVAAEPTGGPGDAGRIATEARRAGAGAAFVLGGDGTVREAAAGLLRGRTALAPLPGGTTNVVAACLGLDRRPLAAARQLAGGGRRRRFDVGICAGEPFLMQASAGLDAAALAGVKPAAKRRFGRLAVASRGLAAWWGYGYPEIEVVMGDARLAGSFVAICNLDRYAGRFRLAPGARPDDGRLDLVLLRGTGRWPTLGFARDLALGRHAGRHDVEMAPLDGPVRLVGPRDVAIQLDGDVVEMQLPVEVTVAAGALEVLGP